MSKEKVVKVKAAKYYSRRQAERVMTFGTVSPERFLNMEDPFAGPSVKDPGASSNHGNYHVRNKAWKMMGKPIPPEWTPEDTVKFYTSIHYNPPATDGQA